MDKKDCVILSQFFNRTDTYVSAETLVPRTLGWQARWGGGWSIFQCKDEPETGQGGKGQAAG
jgi:hypothetical protein